MDGLENKNFEFIEYEACEIPSDRHGQSLRVELKRVKGPAGWQICFRITGTVVEVIDSEQTLCDVVWWYRITPKGLERALDVEEEFESSDGDL
jgi:hypothetical protein